MPQANPKKSTARKWTEPKQPTTPEPNKKRNRDLVGHIKAILIGRLQTQRGFSILDADMEAERLIQLSVVQSPRPKVVPIR